MEAPLILALALLATVMALAPVRPVYAVNVLYKLHDNPSLDCAIGRGWNSSSYCAYYYVVASR
ncbi:hypothetical protein TUZN_1054 [Thermoproteus uzoniensis 768-20]|uniref:Uncharacterized protein n=1 Tax=Thermoproteus uzoniensis (strain 768-20) TaxID=999630 RepID=F2L6D8_THEU7|nr:hypothetical protein [Thermoproteus uzoniensis]AEA12534.1 hypothetical protein TUZN_1054 [Thermoproteus uzoniensis 768-20]